MTRSRSIRRHPQAGLTLIEMLVVLVIIGIATSVIVLSVNSVGRDRRAEDEAMRLAAQLTMAVDEGLVSRAEMALFWTPSGYEVKRRGPKGWGPATTPRLIGAHVLPAAVALRRMDGSRDPVAVAEDGLGAAVSLEITGPGPSWIVAFDGLQATAQSGGAP
jgi:general secretion pathway protein H